MAQQQLKPSRYTAKEETDELGSLATKLANDLRRNIRGLGSYPILSAQWIESAELFGRIANISDMESKLPASKEDATLWETEEQALRFLIEDGKLNLCLRIMVEYKNYQQTLRRCGTDGSPDEGCNERDKFEKGLGVVLRNAWAHVEALQTSDLTGLINHIADVWECGLLYRDILIEQGNNGDLHQRQEVMVFYYLRGMFKHISNVGESRIMPLIRERGLFMLGVRILSLVHSKLLSSHVFTALEALSMMVDTEDFNTFRSVYVAQQSDTDALIALKGSCIDAHSSDFEKRRLLRPLLDCVDKLKRLHSTAGPPGVFGLGSGAPKRPSTASELSHRYSAAASRQFQQYTSASGGVNSGGGNHHRSDGGDAKGQQPDTGGTSGRTGGGPMYRSGIYGHAVSGRPYTSAGGSRK